MIVLAVGCSENGTGNPVSPVSSPLVVDIVGTNATSHGGTAESPLHNDIEEYCELHQIAYATLRNDLRCDAVTVEVDGKYLMTLEPLASVEAFFKAGKHQIVFSRLKEARIVRQIIQDLRPCDKVVFSTGTDICAEAQK